MRQRRRPLRSAGVLRRESLDANRRDERDGEPGNNAVASGEEDKGAAYVSEAEAFRTELVQAGGERDGGRASVAWVLAFVVGVVVSSALNTYHVSAMFEKSLNFSHLSTFEREMTLKTEMGFYYKFYKKLTQSKELYWETLDNFKRDNETEWPKVINCFQRFNIIPEATLAYVFWTLKDFAEERLQWDARECYSVDVFGKDGAGGSVKRVVTCVGPGEPIYFYVIVVFTLAGLTAGCLFALGTVVSSSLLGGFLAVFCFFCNHSHATRVQWTPTLRESFGYPLFVLHTLLLTLFVKGRRGKDSDSWLSNLSLLTGLCLSSAAFLLAWQFAQFALVIDVWVLYSLYCFQVLPAAAVYPYFVSQMAAVALTYSSVHGNNLLASGVLTSALLAVISVGASLGPTLRRHLPPLSSSVAQLGFACVNMIGFKMELSNYLGVSEDDSHVFNLIRAKIGTYRDFDTLLYLGQPEFCRLPGETWMDLCKTLLLPIVFAVVIEYGAFRWGRVKYWELCARVLEARTECGAKQSLTGDGRGFVDPMKALHFCLAAAFALVAGAVMRLKLFLTPQLCVVASIAAARGFLPKPLAGRRAAFFVVLVAGVSIQGWRNLMAQVKVKGAAAGAFSSGEEELMRWVVRETPPAASFAGDMVTMAAVSLLTLRPVVNHPHFEDAEARRRTRAVYQAFSRRPARVLHSALRNLSADFLVLDARVCVESSASSILGVWDALEPDLAARRPPLCPILFDGRANAPFTRVFLNDEYSVLRVDSTRDHVRRK